MFVVAKYFITFLKSSPTDRRKAQTNLQFLFFLSFFQSIDKKCLKEVEFKTNMCDVSDMSRTCETRITIIYDILLYDIFFVCGEKRKKWKLLNRLNFMPCISLWLKIFFLLPLPFKDIGSRSKHKKDRRLEIEAGKPREKEKVKKMFLGHRFTGSKFTLNKTLSTCSVSQISIVQSLPDAIRTRNDF